MIQTISLLPGVRLHCFRTDRFKQESLSVQLVTPMCREAAALNALLPAVLLRGSVHYPDMRQITLHLDDLYGAGVTALGRRVGDYQITGLGCSFLSDRFALSGDGILAPMTAFLRELLLEPALENGVFRADYVESEKKNLLAVIEAQRNDKRAYCADRMLSKMCREDSYGIPRLGTPEQVRDITPQSLYSHYKKLLAAARIELYYVGVTPAEQMKGLVKDFFSPVERSYASLPAQTPLTPIGGGSHTQVMDIAQGKLCMGFATPVGHNGGDYAAMQVCNMLFGGGMTSKLFLQVREKLSLCYDISSGYYGSKGILTVSAGIDWDKAPQVQAQVLSQLKAISHGDFTHEELTAARQALLSALQGVPDSPGSLESYYATTLVSARPMTLQAHMEALMQVDRARVMAAARTLTLDTVYLLKGAEE